MFTHETLSSFGLHFSHDNTNVGRHGAASWPLAIRESTSGTEIPYALPSFAAVQPGFKGSNPGARFRVVVHQVRDTLKCIISRANRIGMMYAPIRYSNPDMFKHLAEGTGVHIAYPPPAEMQQFYDSKGNSDWTTQKRLRVALWHYVLWNEWLDAWADETVRVEDLTGRPEDILHLCEVAGEDCRSRGSKKKAASSTTNSHQIMDELRDVTWDTLCDISPFMCDRAKLLAQSYGYNVPGYEPLR